MGEHGWLHRLFRHLEDLPIIGLAVREDMGLSEMQFGLLVGTPILTGVAVTSFLPFMMVTFGWKAVAQIWAAGVLVIAVAFLLRTREAPRWKRTIPYQRHGRGRNS